MYRVIDNVLSEDDLINIEQNILEAPIFAAYQSTASQQSDNVYDVMMSRVFYSSYYPLCEYNREYLPYFHPLLDKVPQLNLLHSWHPQIEQDVLLS